MKNLFFGILITFSLASAQDMRVGDLPLGTKIIDVGFRNWNYLNVSTVEETDHLLIWWALADFDESVTGFEIIVGVPKCKITEKDFGLIALDSLRLDMSCLNFISPRDIGAETSYLLPVNKFDYVVRLVGYDEHGIVKNLSQIRYVKQKREK